MRFRYTKWMPNPGAAKKRFDQLLKLFNFLLLQTSGDVDEAIDWLKHLNERYQMFNSDKELEAFINKLKGQGLIGKDEKGGGLIVTSKGGQQIRRDSFRDLFSGMQKAGHGDHRTLYPGTGSERLSETRPYQFGDPPSDLDLTSSINNAIMRNGIDDFTLMENDLEVFESEHHSSCAVALLIDISHSMILYGEDRITPAKQVALALSELILTKFPKDSLHVITFGDDAKEVRVEDIPFLKVGPFHTNTKAGLAYARNILRRKRHGNRLIFMVTDGKPSCIYDRGGYYKNSFGLDRRIVNQTLNEAVACRREGITIGTFMIAEDPYLVDFVERLTKACRGRAYYSSLGDLGQSVLVDYVRNRRRKL